VQAPKVGFPQWQGQSLSGKALLVLHEQGLGDQIQFCRYMPMLKAMGASRITLVCDAPLKPLFDRLADVDLVLVAAPDLTTVASDYWCFLLSLPLHCRTATVDDVPAPIPYLRAEPAQVEQWAVRLAEYAEFKVGICWRGSKEYLRDSARSPGLEPFKKLFGLANTRFVSLQPGSRDAFLAAAGAAALDIGHEIDVRDFEETAALIQNLDLVITCDTAVGHLAGALGKTVWVLVPFYADWRWLAEREDSPWYPHTRVFRQTRRGGWEELFERVVQRLQAVAGEPARAG
jgi:ADP-heptose:LPS heptosyltransferase